MTSLKKAEANRLNALKSTGPRSVAGRKRTAQKVICHGLTVSAPLDRSWSNKLEECAHIIVSDAAAPHLLSFASRIAEAEVDLLRIRQARQLLLSRRNDRDDEAAGRVRNSTRRLSLEEIVAEGNVGQVEMLE
jgi:hypothetical protein